MKRILALSGLLLLTGAAVKAQSRLTTFRMRPAISLRMPLQGDSLSFTGSRFTAADLLKTRVDLDFNRHESQTVSADTAGYVRAERPDADSRMYLLATRVRAERFMKASLKITSPVRFEVFVNGVSKGVKTTAEADLKQANSQTVNLRLEPEADYDIVIKMLSCPDDKEQPQLKCELTPDKAFAQVPFHAGPDLKRRFALANTTFGSRVYSTSLSADGKYLLTYYWDNYSLKRSHSYQTLTEVKTGRVIQPNVNTRAKWMPRSTKLYYTVTGETQNNLVVFDPATMREEIVLRDVPEGNFTWAPTEDYLIYSSSDKGEAVQGPLKRMLHPEDRIPGTRSRGYLAKYTPSTGVSERLTYGSNSTYLMDISPDGKKLLCASYAYDTTQRPFVQTTIFQLDWSTMRADTLIAHDCFANTASYSPDGHKLLVTGSPEAFGGIGKNCGNHPIANDYDKQAFIFDIATRKAEAITRDFNPSVELLQWNPKDGCIYFKTTDEDCTNIYQYTPSTRRFYRLPLEENVISSFSLPEQNPTVAAYVGSGSASLGVAYTFDMRRKTSTLIANPMKETLDQITLGTTQEWNFTSRDGTVIKGMACLPPDFDPNRTYPLIVYYYGGTLPTTQGITSPYCPQLFASRDYVVYVIQPSGTIGFGQEFSARHVNAWGDYTIDDIIEGTRKFCQAHPFVNPKRIGCIGASYGGFTTMFMQTRTDLFAAAVSHAGISNVTSYWGEGYWGYSYGAVAAADSYPWSNPELFTRHGALFNADKINTPILLLHGTADTNVPIGESIQLYNALKILGKTVEFVSVDGENHFIADYPKRELWHNTIMAWFARWLQDDASWWNDLYPERHF